MSKDIIGKAEWYGEKEYYCPWKDIDCSAKLELRPTPICLYCILGSIRSSLEEVDIRFFWKNVEEGIR